MCGEEVEQLRQTIEDLRSTIVALKALLKLAVTKGIRSWEAHHAIEHAATTIREDAAFFRECLRTAEGRREKDE